MRSVKSPLPDFYDLSRFLVALEQDSTLIQQSTEPVELAARRPGAGLASRAAQEVVPDADALLGVPHRWRDQVIAAGRPIDRICVAYEAGRDGFGWPAGCAPAASSAR